MARMVRESADIRFGGPAFPGVISRTEAVSNAGRVCAKQLTLIKNDEASQRFFILLNITPCVVLESINLLLLA
jgi:hypothetical protein